jgi:hypothetical protein
MPKPYSLDLRERVIGFVEDGRSRRACRRRSNTNAIGRRNSSSAGSSASDCPTHPDDIIIDTKTGRVRIAGPMTKEEKVRWHRMYARRGMRSSYC